MDDYLQDYDRAIRLLDTSGELSRVGQLWRERAAHHLARRLDKALREGLPDRPPTDEDQFKGVLMTVAQELLTCSDYLNEAAEYYREIGRGFRASKTKQAATSARTMAQSLGVEIVR